MTATDLSQKIDVKAGTVSAYTNNTSKPSIEVLLKICKIFEVSIDDIVLKDIENDFKSKMLSKNELNSTIIENTDNTGKSLSARVDILEARIKELEKKVG